MNLRERLRDFRRIAVASFLFLKKIKRIKNPNEGTRKSFLKVYNVFALLANSNPRKSNHLINGDDTDNEY